MAGSIVGSAQVALVPSILNSRQRKDNLTPIDYNEFGAFTCYTGGLGQGLTLASVMHVAALHKARPDRPVFSNTTLLRIPYTHYDKFTDVEPLPNAIYLIDNLEFLVNRRRAMSRQAQALLDLLMQQRRYGLTIVANYHIWDRQVDVMPSILKYVSTTVLCRLDTEPDTMAFKANTHILSCGDRLYTRIPVAEYYADYDSVAPVVRRGIAEATKIDTEVS